MSRPRFYGQIEDEGRFVGLPFDGQLTSYFKEPRSRIDTVAFEALRESLGRELNAEELASVTITWLHSGADLAPWWIRDASGVLVPNTNVLLRAPCPLEVLNVWDDPIAVLWPASGFGRWVWARTPEGWDVLFAHMERIDVAVGDTLARGESLGIVGTTGKSTGIHTHIMVIEPLNGQPPDWKVWAGRRDFMDYLTMDVDQNEAWSEVGAATPEADVNGWTPGVKPTFQQFIHAAIDSEGALYLPDAAATILDSEYEFTPDGRDIIEIMRIASRKPWKVPYNDARDTRAPPLGGSFSKADYEAWQAAQR